MKKIVTVLLSVVVAHVVISAEATASIIPQNGLVGYWAGDGNALDSSGNGYNGSFWGAPNYVSGVTGQAFQFNGNSGVDIADSNDWSLDGNASFAFWVRFDRSSDPGVNYYQTMISQDEGPTSTRKWFLMDSNSTSVHVNAYWQDPPNYAGAGFGNPQWEIGVWQHLALTKSNSIWSLYKNGSLFSTSAVTGYVPNPSAPLRLGWAEKDRNFSKFSFTGAMDEVVFYNRTLSAAEVGQLAGTAVPVPAAIWLFGSGVLGLIGLAKRKKA